jgi:hypothetical protein
LTEVPETVTSSKQTIVTPAVEKKYITFEATVSQGNTIILGDLTDILYVKLCKKSDGTDVTCTEGTNVVTITESPCSSVAIVGFAYGT